MAVEAIPIVDFADFRSNPKKVAQDVFDACKSIGFFYMINHDVPQQDIDKAFALSKQFFDLPREEKKKGFNFRSFEHGKPFATLPQLFDQEAEFLESFSRNCHATALQILEAFAIALEIPEEKGGKEFFKNGHSYENSAEILRFLKYPRGGEAVYKESVRAGAHSDYGSITLLFQKDVPGLEVQASRTEWISAPLMPGAIIVNVGDQMEMWTNGLFKSTKHRVTFLPEHNHLDRYSMPYFVHPKDDVPLVPAPSKFIDQNNSNPDHILTAGQHLRSRLDSTYDYKK
ncbi:hypothetical protein BD408DRAFT_390790 [Parasitella parasitica]|nr:hypothetical protein BD408DRAFT_390790 [Parasitella parasitica]